MPVRGTSTTGHIFCLSTHCTLSTGFLTPVLSPLCSCKVSCHINILIPVPSGVFTTRRQLWLVALCQWLDVVSSLLTALSLCDEISGCYWVVMAALWNRAGHYIFVLWFLLSFFFLFFPRLISAVGDWMSTILPRMVWPYCEFRMHV